jgi:hypothetical protein
MMVFAGIGKKPHPDFTALKKISYQGTENFLVGCLVPFRSMVTGFKIRVTLLGRNGKSAS